jgi:signal transduction histidine kinase
VAQRTAELIGDACVMTLFSDDGQRSHPVAFYHRDPKALEMMHDALLHTWQGGTDTQRYQALLSGDSIYIPEVDPQDFQASLEPEFRDFFDAIGISSFIIVPLKAQGRVIGTLGITRDRQGVPYTSDDLLLQQNIADRAAMAIENARLFQSIDEKRERLRSLSARLVEVRETERRAIARELHDEVGQLLTGLQITLKMTGRLTPDKMQQNLAEARKLVEQLLDRVQNLSLDLRPTVLDDLGLAPALLWQFERYRNQTGIRVQFDHRGLDRRFVSEVETAAYRIIQEGLTNVARHAGVQEAAAPWSDDGTLGIQIEDLGTGFDAGRFDRVHRPAERDAEQAELLGGAVHHRVTPSAGTLITVELLV